MLIYSFGAGISADEYRHYNQAAKVYKYYQTKGEDKSALENTGIDPLQYNGQSFDNVMYVIQQWFKVDNYMELRHFFNALTGWLVILLSGLIMIEIIGYRSAIFVLLALFFTPRFFGHAFNNNKDIPFAMGFILTIYGTILFLKQMPKPKWNAWLWTTLGIGLSISIRMAGILNIFFLAFSLGLYYLLNHLLIDFTKPDNLKILFRIIGLLVTVTVVGFIIGVAFWPFVIADPVKNVKEIFAAIREHPVSLNQTFRGIVYYSREMPWYYTITYIAITYPLYVLVGLSSLFISFYAFRKYYNIVHVVTILFPWAFVVFWMSYKNSNVYGAIRHITFIYPLAIIAAVLFFSVLLKVISEKGNKTIIGLVVVLIAILSWHSVFYEIKNPRYSYIYYNELIGGVKKAYGKYEMDYFYHSLRAGSEWLIENKINKMNVPKGKKIIVASNLGTNTEYYFRNLKDKVKVIYIRYYDRGNMDWDFAIVANSFLNPYQLKHHLWPPANTIKTFDIDGVPICAILERKDRNDLLGYKSISKGNMREAVTYIKKALQTDKEYEEQYLNLANAYYELGINDSAIIAAMECLKLYPDYEKALDILGMAYIKKNELGNALQVFKRDMMLYPQNVNALYYTGFVFMRSGNYSVALRYLNKAIKLDSHYKPSYYLVARIYELQGHKKDAERVLNYVNSLH